MLQQFYPDHEADSAYGIDYKTLYRKGYRGIIFDIDNTLVPHGHRRHRRRSHFSADCGSWDFRRFYYRTTRNPG